MKSSTSFDLVRHVAPHGRYTGSFETAFKRTSGGLIDRALQLLRDIEASQLAGNFWDVALPMDMETSSVRSPYFLAFLVAQIHNGSRGFLSKNVTIGSMIEEVGDIHHVVPKNYLVKHGVNDRSSYNQIANYALTETPINIGIKDRAPGSTCRSSMSRRPVDDCAWERSPMPRT